MSSEKFLLKWEEFCNNAASSFRDLQEDTDFTDVTLASSDGQTVRAHKVVLSSCSPVLKSMLVKNSRASPLLYLRGVTLSQLETILNFCYLGQVEVLHSDLEELLEVARDLAIKGLSQVDTLGQDQEQALKNSKQTNKKCLLKTKVQKSSDIENEIGTPGIKSEIVKRQATFTYTEGSKGMIEYPKPFALETSESYGNRSKINELSETFNEDNKDGHQCTLCGKYYSIKCVLNRHVKEKHTNDARFSCNECEWTGRRQYSFVAHMKCAHGSIE